MKLEDIPDAVEAFVARHERSLNPIYPRDEDAAIVERSLAKLRTVAARRGLSSEQLGDLLDATPLPDRAAIMREINTVRVDPRTGGGLS